MDPTLGYLILGAAVTALLSAWIRLNLIYRTHRRDECPRCGSDLVRVHRTPKERWIGRLLIYPTGHYKCGSCGWDGLLRRSPH